LRRPVYQKPELLAESPNQVWSWDITKLMGPVVTNTGPGHSDRTGSGYRDCDSVRRKRQSRTICSGAIAVR
jgi:hypothetical protein